MEAHVWQGYRWGVSCSLIGWRITQEEFMKDIEKVND
jgi:hypothetical protein